MAKPAHRAYSFPPVAEPDAQVLILGSMPGIRSLQQQQYYAHPQNLFWPFMGELFGVYAHLDYAARLQALTRNRIALWDVMHTCERKGSLDADILQHSVEVHPFADFFAEHQKIRHVFFNGTQAEHTFKQHVLDKHGLLECVVNEITWQRLPSTSPANASISREQKLAAWREIKRVMGALS